MPLYDYRCEHCDRVFEVRQKFTDPPLTVCDLCGHKVERLLSAPALQFKGSGWYITDYARSGKPESKSESKPESQPAAKAETKSDSKPASASPKKTE